MKALLLLVLGSMLAITAQAQELDPKIIPNEIIVRVDPNGKQDVFKVAVKNDVQNDEAAALAVVNFVTDSNKVQRVVAESELDQVTSTDSWYYYYRPYYSFNYGYSYNYYGHSYNYRPYYNYSYGYYNYYYYRYY